MPAPAFSSFELAILNVMATNPEFAKDAHAYTAGKTPEQLNAELQRLVKSPELQKELQTLGKDVGEEIQAAFANVVTALATAATAASAAGNRSEHQSIQSRKLIERIYSY